MVERDAGEGLIMKGEFYFGPIVRCRRTVRSFEKTVYSCVNGHIKDVTTSNENFCSGCGQPISPIQQVERREIAYNDIVKHGKIPWHRFTLLTTLSIPVLDREFVFAPVMRRPFGRPLSFYVKSGEIDSKSDLTDFLLDYSDDIGVLEEIFGGENLTIEWAIVARESS